MDWIGAVLTLIATYLLASHRRQAVRVFLLSSILFLVWAIREEVWSLVMLQSVLIVLNIRTLYKWRQT